MICSRIHYKMPTTISKQNPQDGSIHIYSSFDHAAYSAYEQLKAEKDAIANAEAVYKRRIESLEIEAKNLLKSYQDIYAENKVLRSKIEHGPDANRIRKFRAEITRLENKNSALATKCAMLQGEMHNLQKQEASIEEDKKRQDESFQMERNLHLDKTTAIEKERRELEKKLEAAEKDKEEFEARMKNYMNEVTGLTDRYKDIKRENLKMETKFKKQKDLANEEALEAKTSNRLLIKEVALLKMKISKQESEYNAAKVDLESAKKTVEFQNKEIEVFKDTTARMQKDLTEKSEKSKRLQHELNSVEGLLEDAKDDGFEAIYSERRAIKMTEEKLRKRIGVLEIQVEELASENAQLERNANEYRHNWEAAVLEKQDLMYAEAALKRRIETLEQSLRLVDSPGKYVLEKASKSVVVTMGNDKVKNVEKEKQALLNKNKSLEIENRKLERRIRELMKSGGSLQDYEENWTLPFQKPKKRRGSDHTVKIDLSDIHADNSRDSSYRRKLVTARSLPLLTKQRQV